MGRAYNVYFIFIMDNNYIKLVSDKKWLEEEVTDVTKFKSFYKIICFLIRRKIRYKEFYAFLCQLNRRKHEMNDIKKIAMYKTMSLYLYNKNKNK